MKACDLGRLRSRLAEYLVGLRHHIRVEEEIFFPAFEARSGMHGAGPTAVMRHEHREIEAILERLAALTKLQDCRTIAEAVQGQALDPSALLRSHDTKEENVLYPMSDHILNQDERRGAHLADAGWMSMPLARWAKTASKFSWEREWISQWSWLSTPTTLYGSLCILARTIPGFP